MPKVLVTEAIVGEALDQLCSEFDVCQEPELWNEPQRLLASVGGFDALIVGNQTRVNAELITAGKRLMVIARAGTGLDRIDVDAASDAGIVVTYAPHGNAVSVAEMTIGLMLALARRIPAADADTRHGGWNRQDFVGRELMGKTLGVIGLGWVGTLTVQRAKPFGMRIIAYDAFVDPASLQVRQLGVQMLDLDELLRRSDMVTCHLSLTEDTRGWFNAARLARMKPGALLINTSRGEIIDEQALLEALQNGRLAGAALDVREHEPPAAHPLAALPNVILTPHISAFTEEAQQRIVRVVCRDVAAVLRGQEAHDFANFATPRALPADVEP